jgi:hypothetical protein
LYKLKRKYEFFGGNSMFCSKCGAQLPDGAAFCGSCGNPTGANAQQPKQASGNALNGMPPILGNLLKRVIGFFTGTRQEAVVLDSVKDTTWSGAILAGVGILVFVLTQLVNASAPVRSYWQLFGADFGDAFEAASETTALGAAFLLSLLFAVVYAGALVGMTFVMVKMFKGNLSFLNVVNIAAYASLPVVAICIPNMLFGLLWGVLPMILFAAAMMASFYLIYRTVSEVCGAKNGFVPYTVFVVAMLLVVGLGAYFIMSGTLNVEELFRF